MLNIDIYRYLERSSRGHTDPLRAFLDAAPTYRIITTNAVKLTLSTRQEIESKRPKTITFKTTKPQKLAIIIPYRNRVENRDQFIPYMRDYLDKQAVKATIYLIEQPPEKPFNRGFLKNIGAHIAREEQHDFLCFHDIDLLPIDVIYNALPAHPYRPFSRLKRSGKKYQDICPEQMFNETCFGGIICFPTDQFSAIHGYSNTYWGWGCEDDDLLIRALSHGQTPILHKSATIKNLPHKPATHKVSNYALQMVDSYAHKQRISQNRKKFQKMKRELWTQKNDLQIISDQDYTIVAKKKDHYHIMANTDRLIKKNMPSQYLCKKK